MWIFPRSCFGESGLRQSRETKSWEKRTSKNAFPCLNISFLSPTLWPGSVSGTAARISPFLGSLRTFAICSGLSTQHIFEQVKIHRPTLRYSHRTISRQMASLQFPCYAGPAQIMRLPPTPALLLSECIGKHALLPWNCEKSNAPSENNFSPAISCLPPLPGQWVRCFPLVHRLHTS